MIRTPLFALVSGSALRAALVGLWLALAVLAAAPGTALADQNDSRLDPLFARLAATDDGMEARTVEQLIWSIWNETGDKALDAEMTLGLIKMQEGDAEAALAVFERMVVQAPNYAEAWNKRATLYYFLNRYDESIADVHRTLALEPRHFGALAGIGMIYYETGRPAEAADWMEKALAVNPHLWAVEMKLKELRAQGAGKQI